VYTVNIRIAGLPDDVAAAAAIIAATMPVLDQSQDYPNRAPSRHVRRYLTVEVAVLPTAVTEQREDQPCPNSTPANS
jgi:hypothetical protein